MSLPVLLLQQNKTQYTSDTNAYDRQEGCVILQANDNEKRPYRPGIGLEISLNRNENWAQHNQNDSH